MQLLDFVMKYEAVIGLEVHVQIKTKSKLFAKSGYSFGQPPNTLTDPVVLALPGSLPTVNKEAVLKTIKAGMIFGCDIIDTAKWIRKHYFYPDCPKNYQISQNADSICKNGYVEIELDGPSRNVMGEHKKIALDHIHLEEDVGKLTHFDDESGVDFNRAGVALMEIVSKPDMRSADEAFAYLSSIRMNMSYAGISNCDMEKGEIRCDANVSVRPVGQEKLGTRIEIKNLNSISGVRNSLEYEIKRQIDVLESGGTLSQETRRWNADSGTTSVMRSKEMTFDYRGFDDPDIMPLEISKEVKDKVRSEIPEMPFAKQERYFKQYKLPYTVTSVICQKRELSELFESAVAIHNNPITTANFIVNDMLREMSQHDATADTEGVQSNCDQFQLSPERLSELVKLIDDGVISKKIAGEVFVEMFHGNKSASKIVEAKGLRQNTNTDELRGICQSAIDKNQKAVNEFKSGKDVAINAIKGFVMKETKGKANPAIIDKMLREMLTK